MSKLLFVVPNYSDEEVNHYLKKILTVPYGVLSLASYVEYYCPDGAAKDLIEKYSVLFEFTEG